MRHLVLMFLCLAPATALAAPAGLRAEKPRRYAIGEVIFDGEVPPDDRRKLEANLWPTIALLIGDGGELMDSRHVLELVADHAALGAGRCRDDKCALALGDLLKVNRLLTIKLERTDEPPSGWKWTAQILNFSVDAAEVVGSAVVPCARCNADELLRELANSFGAVFKNDPPRPLCRLSVASLPPGGTIAIDTIELAQAPFAHTIAAGRHTIAVEHERFAKGQAEVDCKAGGAMDISFTLDEKQSTSATRDLGEAPPRAGALRLAGGALLGLGVAGLAGGAALVAINGEPACDRTAGQRRCPERYQTALGGGLLLGGALLAVAGGVVSLVVDARRRHPGKF